MFIGLISDSHGVFSQEFKDFLSPVDCIWHAGDFGGGLKTAFEIASFKPLTGVSGNCDDFNLRFDYPLYQFFECDGAKVLMTHIGGSPGHYEKKAERLIDLYHPDIFVCGHSHILKVMNDPVKGLLFLNPGACGIQGWHIERTALRFHIDNGVPSRMEVFRLPR